MIMFGPFGIILEAFFGTWEHFGALWAHFLNQKSAWGSKGAPRGATPEIKSPFWRPFEALFPGKGVGPGFSLFPERAQAQGSLCPVRPLGLIPGVCSLQVGGFFCRKNAVFLSRTLKNCRVLLLGLVARGAWASRFYAYLRCLSPVCLIRGTQ